MKESASLQHLLAIIGTGEFEDNGQMRAVSVRWSADRLAVRLQLDHGTGENSTWHLRFTGVLEYRFTDVYNCGLNVWHGNHPAIKQYVEPRELLHFAVAPEDPHHVIGALWSAHRELVDDWIPFDRYLNLELPLDQLLASGSGMLAKGPTFLIAAYAAILDSKGCEPTRKELRAGRSVQKATLTHFGGSYVVAGEVVAKRLPN